MTSGPVAGGDVAAVLGAAVADGGAGTEEVDVAVVEIDVVADDVVEIDVVDVDVAEIDVVADVWDGKVSTADSWPAQAAAMTPIAASTLNTRPGWGT